MAQPFFGSGVTPMKSSTKLMLLEKQIAALGGTGVNACSRSDTPRVARLKIERIRAGKTNPA